MYSDMVEYSVKQSQQGPQKLGSLKSIKIQTPYQYWAFSLMQPSEMAPLSISRWQYRKERPKR